MLQAACMYSPWPHKWHAIVLANRPVWWWVLAGPIHWKPLNLISTSGISKHIETSSKDHLTSLASYDQEHEGDPVTFTSAWSHQNYGRQEKPCVKQDFTNACFHQAEEKAGMKEIQ